KGLLAKRLYVVFTRPKDPAKMGALVGPHLEYQAELERRGIMFGAGPLADETETKWNGDGMVIIRAKDMAEAKKIADADPMHTGGGRGYEIRPWLMNEGTISIRVNYVTGKYTLE
ncbi:MAG: hypothetical protein FJX53_03570, partial [Alphaproteobacteria bacterium]|nr:hypothetical protein [Alphaproteobacteria bacterium]